MSKTQLARGIWANFAATEDPFAVPNGMEDNLRTLDDHIALYTLSAPIEPDTQLPVNVESGAGQVFSDGGYAVFNAGIWRRYRPRIGLVLTEPNSKQRYLCTGAAWESIGAVVADKTYLTRAQMNADFVHDVGTQGRVVNDPAHTIEAPVNGNYTWMGASGWVWSGLQTLDLYTFLRGLARFDGFTNAEMARITQPNVFTADQLTFSDLPTVVAGTSAVVRLAGRAVLRVDGAVSGGGQNVNLYWRFPASRFPSGLASACISFDAASAGTTGSIAVVSRNAAGAQLSATSITAGVSTAISSPTEFRIEAATLDPAAVYVDLRVDLTNSVGSKYVSMRSMMLADGPDAGFRTPMQKIPDVPLFSYFPGSEFGASGASLYQAARIQEAGEYVLSMTPGGALSQAYWDAPAIGALASGSTLEMTADAIADATGAGTSADIGIVFLDAGGAQIGSPTVPAIVAINAYQKLTVKQVVPAAAANVRFRFVKRAPASYAKFRRVAVTSDSATAKIVPLQTSGSSGPSKVIVDPAGEYSTIQAGINAAKPFGTVIVRAGDYAPFSITGFYGRILAYRGERVRVIGGTVLTGVTKSAGYSYVYQAPWATAPGHYLWEHDTPDAATLISAGERHPLQRGLANRLPSTRLLPMESIAAVEASTVPAWYHDGATLYFRTSDGLAPGARQIIVPAITSTAYSCVIGGAGDEVVDINGITTMYGYNGFRLVGCSSVRLANCDALCSASDGISVYDTPAVELAQCRAGGSGNDGTNGHPLTASTHNAPLNFRVIDSWCHDNWDDGDSLHERCVGSYVGGLYEYNGSGIATAVGAHVTMIGGLVRKNGLASGNGRPDPKDFGVGIVGAAADGGVGTQMTCHGTVSIGNGINFAAQCAADNTLACIATKSYRASIAGYSGSSGGTVIMRDAGDSGSAVAASGAVSADNTYIAN